MLKVEDVDGGVKIVTHGRDVLLSDVGVLSAFLQLAAVSTKGVQRWNVSPATVAALNQTSQRAGKRRRGPSPMKAAVAAPTPIAATNQGQSESKSSSMGGFPKSVRATMRRPGPDRKLRRVAHLTLDRRHPTLRAQLARAGAGEHDAKMDFQTILAVNLMALSALSLMLQHDNYTLYINNASTKKSRRSKANTHHEFTIPDRNIDDNTPILVP